MRAPNADPEEDYSLLATVGAAAAGFLVAGPPGALVAGATTWGVNELVREARMVSEKQMLAACREIIAAEVKVFEQGSTVEVRNQIPDTVDVPIQDPRHWLKIPDVTCVYVDMKNSTKLSATNHDHTTAAAYQLFTGGAVRILNCFEPAYIDVRGDGAFALFNKGEEHRALVAAVSFKTFAREVATKKIKAATDQDVGCHIGIDQKTVLVKKVGMKRAGGRTDRQNEVWAGKPVNMAAKLASLTNDDEILVSDRFFARLTDAHAKMSCGCGNKGVSTGLWTERDLSGDARFDFKQAFLLKSMWCVTHGAEYANALLSVRAA